MDRYRSPSRRKIAEHLARAGADADGQISGSLWILVALQGVGISKLDSKDLQHLRDAKKRLDQAMGELAAIGGPFTSELPANFPMHREEPKQPLGWLNADVIEPIARASWHLDLCIATYRTPKHKKHAQFWEVLHRYFVSQNLDVTYGESSPIVLTFVECTGSQLEAGYQSIKRFRKVQK